MATSILSFYSLHFRVASTASVVFAVNRHFNPIHETMYSCKKLWESDSDTCLSVIAIYDILAVIANLKVKEAFSNNKSFSCKN
jgi:hypothetical protein